MRKSQIQSQMFIYILTILVVGLMLYFGVKWIGGLIITGNQMEEARFVRSLNDAFDEVRPNYKSGRNRDFLVPSGIDRVCFVDTGTRPTSGHGLCSPSSADYDPLMCNTWQENISGVLFSPPLSLSANIGAVQISTAAKYLCFDTANNPRVRVYLTSLGNMVRVEPQ